MDIFETFDKKLKTFMPITENDLFLQNCALNKVKEYIKNTANIKEIPEGLDYVVIDRAIGEFLAFKKGTGTLEITNIDLDAVFSSIQEGDTRVDLGYGKGTQTLEQRLDGLINYLITYGEKEILGYRRLRW